jgi:hypothetical protein
MTDAQIVLLLQTLQNIEHHLATVATASRDTARVQLQLAMSPVR